MQGGARRHPVPDEIGATLVDNVVNHGLTMAEAGRRVQPNVPRSTVSSIIQAFRRENSRDVSVLQIRTTTTRTTFQGYKYIRQTLQIVLCRSLSKVGQHRICGGEKPESQKREICNLVIANNAINLRQIRDAIIQDNVIFRKIQFHQHLYNNRVLRRHQMTMKQIYKVPSERNSDRVKELRYQYVNKIKEVFFLALDQMTLLHAMDAACEDITGDQWKGWLKHSRCFFPRCSAREKIYCDVDENLRPNREERVTSARLASKTGEEHLVKELEELKILRERTAGIQKYHPKARTGKPSAQTRQ
ncbi:hypothetical protein WMY93_034262 [Mugilogobius chulae]|uniref:Transposase Tc1-like domain-containing protein n=1 Tax=Mugilogobius chulae TaxID=88201 RepID=A0AAW0MQ74_9GOBI